MTVIGVDAHKRTHTFVAVDVGGRKIGERTVATTSEGHAEAIGWAVRSFGTDVVWAVEDNRALTNLLESDLLAAGPWKVLRCPPHVMARARASGREQGKSDPIDALAVARAALREPNLPVAFHDAVSWELRQLVERREDLVYQRTGVMNRVYARVHLIDPGHPPPARLHVRSRREALSRYLRTRDGMVVGLARDEVDDLEYLSRRIDSLTERIVDGVDGLQSSLLSVMGCAHLTAAKFIGEAANVDRFRSESAFAAYCGAAPVPRWSGASAGNVRASRGGNRQLNTALHRVALVQIAKNGPGKAYYDHRRAEGDSGADAVRRLKRKLCRVVFQRLRADYARRMATPAPDPAPARAVEDQIPAWLAMVDLAASLGTERDARRRADAKRVARTDRAAGTDGAER